jgi:hypothetical protein
MRAALPVTVLLVSACSAAGDPVPLLTFDGYGAVRFGMTVAEAEHSAGGTAKAARAEAGSQTCYYASFTRYPHARFMVEDGHIARAELDNSGRNTLGLSVGMRLTDVRERFPAVSIRPHKYDETGHYLLFASQSGKSEIVAEESRGRITMIRGGLLPAVEYVEGCR